MRLSKINDNGNVLVMYETATGSTGTITKGQIQLIFSDDNGSVEFRNPSTRLSILAAPVPLSRVLDGDNGDAPFSRLDLITYFNEEGYFSPASDGGASGATDEYAERVYTHLRTDDAPFTTTGNDLDAPEALVYDSVYEFDETRFYKVALWIIWSQTATNVNAQFRLDIDGAVGTVFSLEPKDSTNVTPEALAFSILLPAGQHTFSLRSAKDGASGATISISYAAISYTKCIDIPQTPN